MRTPRGWYTIDTTSISWCRAGELGRHLGNPADTPRGTWATEPAGPSTASNVAGNIEDKAVRREREMAVLRQRVEFDWRI